MLYEVITILAAGSKTQWMASAVQHLAGERSLQGVDVRGRPWIEIDYAEDLEDARRRVWPLIQRQRMRADAFREKQHVKPVIGTLCHDPI